MRLKKLNQPIEQTINEKIKNPIRDHIKHSEQPLEDEHEMATFKHRKKILRELKEGEKNEAIANTNIRNIINNTLKDKLSRKEKKEEAKKEEKQ